MTERKIVMAKGNYGVGMAINIKDEAIQEGDKLKFVIKQNTSVEERIIEKIYDVGEIQDGIIVLNVILTEEESKKLEVGNYIWGIEHTREGMLSDLPLDSVGHFYAEFIVKSGV